MGVKTMAKRYNQGVSVASARFTKAPMGEVEYSKFYGEPVHNTTFNAGDIVPIYCNEVLPHDTWSMDVDEVIRQATLAVPTMNKAIIDVFAYFVPNRVVNKSWVNVMGQNDSGQWIAPKVSLAPLVRQAMGNIQIPVGSVADYYGFPTQKPIPNEVLSSCHDLKFRGYLEIYNNYFRDQNYQPPIPYSKLNVYNGFLELSSNSVPFSPVSFSLKNTSVPDGSVGEGAIAKELLGSKGSRFSNTTASNFPGRIGTYNALTAPLKANKLHDYFTSVLPSPQKGEEVVIGLGERAPVVVNAEVNNDVNTSIRGIKFRTNSGDLILPANSEFNLLVDSDTQGNMSGLRVGSYSSEGNGTTKAITGVNLGFNGYADLSQATGISIADLRMSAAIQQVYEILGRGGSRYTEYINSFFELDIDNPFNDIPTCLGHIRRDLDLYQTAQTSATTDSSAQGSLSAFGYTSTGGKLFTRTFLEHGYIHVLAVVRHRNIYPALLSRDNFRLEQMDFYQYPLANISEQPVYTREINPFAGNDQVFGYQEAWAEYRLEQDRVSGQFRTGLNGSQSLAEWTYADEFDANLRIADGDWLESNTADVVRRGTALTDKDIPQFKGSFIFKITKERAMPTYSMSGLDIL